jgi:alanine racemase
MSLFSHVASVKEINPGDSVSYGRKFTAEKKMKVVSVPIGYADGYNRALTNKGKAIIKDKVYKQIGTVTMDRIIGHYDDKIEPGDKVILLGESKNQSGICRITAWDWAKELDTIPYEITCNISKRVPRIYKT